MRLSLLGCAYRTCACTSAAVDTGIGVDNILAVSLGNSSYRAAVCTSTAADALVIDGVSHC